MARVRVVKGGNRRASEQRAEERRATDAGDEQRSAGGRRDAVARRASAARRAAFEVLRRVEDEGAFAAPLLASVAEELRADDRALCHELVLGCLRRQLWLDRLTERYAGRAAATLDAPVRRALRLGLYQLRFLSRVPASAAVNESVNLMHEAQARGAAGFVNAVLRRATREPGLDPAADIADPLERLSVETSHPLWLLSRWASAFGLEEAARFARANNERTPVAFRVNRLRGGAEETLGRVREAGGAVVESRFAPGAWRVEDGGARVNAVLRELSAAGAIYMQDEASQLVAHVLGARAGERVLDACAAPGSKTTHLAALAGDAAVVVAGDRHEHRLRLVREAAERQGLRSVRAVVHDAEAGLPYADQTFDRVLVDAPCTGTGTLRHNPEIRWRITSADIEELAARQRRILGEAARVVRRGGRLVYSTCSVEPEENEHVVRSFLAESEGFAPVPPEHAAARLLTDTGAARTWPHRDDADGFFVAAFERTKL
ncbi:MAG TPA: 16S rRNA (cytosine(967)-C(5))-methyltransferase RsmB [Pyrinomonadaceae bacterium]|nr:16S rRNA (cytosine(967)-C(5))-methyltransferase RsmB [Pyrinomonadaceae bacterium]